MTLKTEIFALLDLVPEPELPTLLEVVKHFVPVDSDHDDVATPDDLAAHEEAMREYAVGETVPHEMIDWN